MKITPAWKDAEGKGLKDIGWALEYDGSISFDEAIKIEIGSKCLKVSGSLTSKLHINASGSIEAGGGIKAGEWIEAGWGIEAGEWIMAGGGIEAGGGIKAGEWIEAGGGIKAGGWIMAGGGIKAGFQIRCRKTLAFRFNLFAGTAVWKKTTEDDQLVECAELKGGEIKHGILRIISPEGKTEHPGRNSKEDGI